MKLPKFVLTTILLLIFLLFLSPSPSTACTVITTSNGDAILFGYNEDRSQDQFDQDTTIKFYNSTPSDFAYMGIEATEPGLFSLRAAINERGLAVSGNGLPITAISEHPLRTYSWRYHSFYNLVIRNCANISSVIEIVNDFDFGTTMAYQVHIADSSGNAIVVSPGSDGEIAITHKRADYFISTNKNRDAIESGTYDSRDSMAKAVVENDPDLNRDDVKELLDTIHQEGPDSVTYYSTIFDLTNLQSFLYLWHDYSTEIVLDLDYEFSLGDHSYVLQDLFQDGATIIEDGERTFARLVIVTTVLRIVAVLLSAAILLNLVYRIYILRKFPVQSGQSIRSTIIIKILSSGFGITFVLINAVFLPLLLFTNFADSMIRSQTIVLEFYLFIGVWATALGFSLYYLGNYRRRTRRELPI